MAITTRGITTLKTSIVKIFPRPKTSSRFKAFNTAKAVKWTKSTLKTAPKPALTQPLIQIKTILFLETVISDRIDEIDIKISKDYKIMRRLIISELVKIMLKLVTTN